MFDLHHHVFDSAFVLLQVLVYFFFKLLLLVGEFHEGVVELFYLLFVLHVFSVFAERLVLVDEGFKLVVDFGEWIGRLGGDRDRLVGRGGVFLVLLLVLVYLLDLVLELLVVMILLIYKIL